MVKVTAKTVMLIPQRKVQLKASCGIRPCDSGSGKEKRSGDGLLIVSIPACRITSYATARLWDERHGKDRLCLSEGGRSGKRDGLSHGRESENDYFKTVRTNNACHRKVLRYHQNVLLAGAIRLTSMPSTGGEYGVIGLNKLDMIEGIYPVRHYLV